MTVFYTVSAVSVIATVLAVTRKNAMHALFYLIVSLLGVAVILFMLGAPFAAALEVIIYAGAIMVFFIFVVMMLNTADIERLKKRRSVTTANIVGPAFLTAILAAELVYILVGGDMHVVPQEVSPKKVGIALYGPYVLGVELASMLLLAGLVGAYHLGRRSNNTDAGKKGQEK
jgi:NADH-quinone oxidoreductase subunit J